MASVVFGAALFTINWLCPQLFGTDVPAPTNVEDQEVKENSETAIPEDPSDDMSIVTASWAEDSILLPLFRKQQEEEDDKKLFSSDGVDVSDEEFFQIFPKSVCVQENVLNCTV